MSFQIKCNKCNSEIEIKENFFKKEDISIEITGEEIVRIKCSFCKNEIYSSHDE